MEEFAGTPRFRIIRRVGAGGMGVVYEALDKERDTHVALKTLRTRNPEHLTSLKHEFRSLRDLVHPNLVQLGELVQEGPFCFFTMELIHGEDFLQYVRPPGEDADDEAAEAVTVDIPPEGSIEQSPEGGRMIGDLDEERLRASLAQLARGLHALHVSEMVHRDIKPSNVLVDTAGRVVLLDFGLVVASSSARDTAVVGTVAYMAPEQVTGAVGPAADWYSMGVMLFEALTGTLPFVGPTLEVLQRKQTSDALIDPRTIEPTAPADLSELCTQLLQRDPLKRPSGDAIIAKLGSRRDDVVRSGRTASLLGRERELAALDRMLSEVAAGLPVLSVVSGDSGVGKTALLRHFEEIAAGREALVLSGRCHERETVPYKAFDGALESLALHLGRLSALALGNLLPPQANLLSLAFPVFARLERKREPAEILDPTELRRRMFQALRELLTRVATQRPLVLAVDDLQWGDADSFELLAELTRPPSAPPILYLGTVRTGEERPPILDHLARLPLAQRPMTLLPLDAGAARALAEHMLAERGAQTGDAQRIATEAAGHPLFIDELVSHVISVGELPGEVRLDDALLGRVAALGEAERVLLEVVAVSGMPLRQHVVAAAAGFRVAALGPRVATLRAANLVRTTGLRRSDLIEPYHDRVRRVVVEHLLDDRKRVVHRRLADALAADPAGDQEALSIHLEGAGDIAGAATAVTNAAHRADVALAFERAARLYKRALALGTTAGLPVADQRALQLGLANALSSSGRAAEAADAFLEAARGADLAEARDARWRAADQLLRFGRIDEALAILEKILAEVGLPLQPSPLRALPALFARRAQLRLRGLSYRSCAEADVAPELLARIDVSWAISRGISVVDTIRGAEAQTRNLLLALRGGEPYRIARAIALEAGFSAAGGTANARRTAELLGIAAEMAEKIAHAHAIGWAKLCAGFAGFLEGRWRAGATNCRDAESVFRERCVGVSWEIDSAQLFGLWSRYYLGEITPLAEEVSRSVREAVARGDLYGATSLRTRVSHAALLAAGDARAARAEVQAGVDAWSHRSFLAQHYFALFADVQIDLYTGDAERALERIAATDKPLRRALLLQVQLIRIELLHLHARAALLRAEQTADKKLLKTVTQNARALEREDAPWATALAGLLRAALHARAGQWELAGSGLESTEHLLTSAGMALYSAATWYVRAQLANDPAMVGEAKHVLESLGVREPDAFARMLLPGFRR